MAERPIATGTVMSQFGAPTKTEYSPFAPLPPELTRLVDQLARVEYPITSKRELLEKLGGPAVPVFIGENVVEAAAALMFIPANFFPLATPANLAEKLSSYYATRRPLQRQRPLGARPIQDLARRFVTENPELVSAVAKAIESVRKDQKLDDDAIAARFLKSNQRLIDAVAAAFRDLGRLRAKAREDRQERGESAG